MVTFFPVGKWLSRFLPSSGTPMEPVLLLISYSLQLSWLIFSVGLYFNHVSEMSKITKKKKKKAPKNMLWSKSFRVQPHQQFNSHNVRQFCAGRRKDARTTFPFNFYAPSFHGPECRKVSGMSLSCTNKCEFELHFYLIVQFLQGINK